MHQELGSEQHAGRQHCLRSSIPYMMAALNGSVVAGAFSWDEEFEQVLEIASTCKATRFIAMQVN